MTVIPPRNAASVILINDDKHALLVKKSAKLAFSGGAWVFPGGKLESADLLDSCFYKTNKEAQTDSSTLQNITAVCRETFEEIGVLLVRQNNGDVCDAPLTESLQWWRNEINNDAENFSKMLRTHNLHINLADFIFWSNWITPSMVPKRFDTQFYVAKMPCQQSVKCDNAEATKLKWLDLTTFNLSVEETRIPAPPTLYSLADLADSMHEHISIESLFTLEASRDIQPVMPKIVKIETDDDANKSDIKVFLPWHKSYQAQAGEGTSHISYPHRYKHYPDLVKPSVKMPGMPK